MAAKFVVLALAVCSVSASCDLPCFQQEGSDVFGSSGAPVVVAAAPSLVQPQEVFSSGSGIPAGAVISSGSGIPAGAILSSGAGIPAGALLSSGAGIAVGGAGSSGPSVSGKPLQVLQAPPVTLNAVESPVIRLPSPPIPGPKVIRHRCFCTKTIVRPQVIQRTITVPRIQRYLKQSYRPIVENVAYQAKPLGGAGESQGQDIVIGGGAGGAGAGLIGGSGLGPLALASASLSTGPVALSSGPVALSSGPVALSSGPVALSSGPVAVSSGPVAVASGSVVPAELLGSSGPVAAAVASSSFDGCGPREPSFQGCF